MIIVRNPKFVTVLLIGLFLAAGIMPLNSMAFDTHGKDEKNTLGIINLIDEGFEGTTWPPTGWTTSSYFWYQGPIFGEPSHSGDHHTYSISSSDSMITPLVDFDVNTELTFWYAAESAINPMNLEVYLDSTTLLYSDYAYTHTTYQMATVDLSSYTGDHTIEFLNSGDSSLYGQMIDDIIVSTEIDTQPPVITNVNAQPNIQLVNGNVNITCTVTDDRAVDEVIVYITYPDTSTLSFPMVLLAGTYYFDQIYSAPGDYDYYIWANDTSNNIQTSSVYHFEINIPPTADFTYAPPNPSTADNIAFTDLSTDTDGTIVSWLWNFGDGDTSSAQYPSHSYDDDGIYTVTLTVEDDDGATDIDTEQITVTNVGPTADFTYAPPNPSTADNIAFTDLSTDTDGTIVSWLWNFGDGDTSSAQYPSHSYDDDGIYTVTLTVEDDDGATDIDTEQITVTNVGPTADFTYAPPNPTILDTIDFSDLSTDTDGTIANWTWDFDDGSYSYIPNPSHNYPTIDIYNVSLTVTDDDGASDTIIIPISVAGPEILDINQSLFDRGFRVMPGWDGAQEFIPSYNVLSHVDVYMTKWGSPWGPIVVQICEDSPDGTVVFSDTIHQDAPPDFPTFDWVSVNIGITVDIGEKYVLVLRDGDDGDTHNTLMWGWCDSYGGNGPYPDGKFLFSKLGYPTWLPIHDWDFTFKTYGYN